MRDQMLCYYVVVNELGKETLVGKLENELEDGYRRAFIVLPYVSQRYKNRVFGKKA